MTMRALPLFLLASSARGFSCLQEDTDFFGNDLSLSKGVPSALACQELCQQTDGCAFFSWLSPSHRWTAGRNNCYLKTASAAGSGKADEGVTSGPRACSGGNRPAPTTPTDGTGTVSVVTQNLFWWNLFGQRGGASFFSEFGKYKPFDILLFQECDDVDHIVSGLGLGGRFKTYQGNRAVSVAWDAERFEEVAKGHDVVGEDLPGLYGSRGATWVRLREKNTGRHFLAVSHHGPLPINSGGQGGGKELSSQLSGVVSRNTRAGDTVFLGGDFNNDRNSVTIELLSSEFGAPVVGDWVDFIFTNGEGVLPDPKTTVIHNTGSDHRGLKAVFQLE